MAEDIKESAVQVTLPDEPITQVELEDDSSRVVDEAPKIEKVKADKDVEAEPKVDDREKALNDLRRQYEHQKKIAQAEREARQQAEAYARQQAQHIGYAQNEVQDSNLKIILNAIDATEQAAANAERDYAEAMAAGNYAMAAKAQRLIAQAESHLLQLQNGKSKLEESLQEPVEGSVYAQQVPSFEPNIPQDPVEMYASRLAPKSAQWLREHPDAVGKIGKLTRAHQDATEDGIVPESPEYFRYIEDRLGYSGQGNDEPPAGSYQEPQRVSEATPARKSMASAPVTSSASMTSSRSNGNPNQMTLSSSEVEVALLMEPELSRDKAIEAYAKNKLALIKSGKISA
jgi:hypothetical protein